MLPVIRQSVPPEARGCGHYGCTQRATYVPVFTYWVEGPSRLFTFSSAISVCRQHRVELERFFRSRRAKSVLSGSLAARGIQTSRMRDSFVFLQ